MIVWIVVRTQWGDGCECSNTYGIEEVVIDGVFASEQAAHAFIAEHPVSWGSQEIVRQEVK